MVCLMANGLAGNHCIDRVDDSYKVVKENLFHLMRKLARDIARDGEGATKLLECICDNAPDENIAENIAKTVITSSLVKTAMFGADANWGRILCAIGYSDATFAIDRVDVALSSKAGVNGDYRT